VSEVGRNGGGSPKIERVSKENLLRENSRAYILREEWGKVIPLIAGKGGTPPRPWREMEEVSIGARETYIIKKRLGGLRI